MQYVGDSCWQLFLLFSAGRRAKEKSLSEREAVCKSVMERRTRTWRYLIYDADGKWVTLLGVNSRPERITETPCRDKSQPGALEEKCSSEK